VIQNVIGHSNPAMTAHYTHVNEDTARQVAGVLTLGGEQARPALPDWERELVEGMAAKNWKQIKGELLG